MRPIVGLIGAALQSVAIIAPYPQSARSFVIPAIHLGDVLWLLGRKVEFNRYTPQKGIAEVGHSMSCLIEGIRVPIY